jgi:hypothetical protein
MLRENVLSTSREVFGTLLRDEQLLELYMENLARNAGFWGGEECLHAFSNVFQARVIVYFSTGTSTVYEPRDRDIVKEINLFYANYNHYDSVTQIRSLLDSAPLDRVIANTGSSYESQDEVSEISTIQNLICPQGTSQHLQNFQSINLGTWNIRGGARSEKRDEVDCILSSYGLDLVCVQELRTSSRVIYTQHYKWFVNAHNKQRGFRGTAILVKRNWGVKFKSFASITENICVLQLEFRTKVLSFVCFHSPSEGSNLVYNEYVKLGQFIQSCPLSHEFMVLGDWNAHVGFDDRENDCKHVGTILGHYESNGNGHLLYSFLRIHDLELISTKMDKSCNYTWQREGVKSQLDHIVRKIGSILFVQRMKGIWYENISDHKLIKCNVKLYQANQHRASMESRKFISVKRKWDLDLLKSAAIREKYQENLVEKFTSYQVSHNCNENWTLFSGHITTAAQEVLRPRKRPAPADSATKIVLDQFKRAKFDFGKIFALWAKNPFFMKILNIEFLPICRTFNLNSVWFDYLWDMAFR